MSVGEVLQVARLSVSALAVGAGLLLMLGAVLGVLRFPDFYTRLHMAAPDFLGAMLVTLGLALAESTPEIALRLVLFALLLGVLGPMWSYLLGAGASAGGLAPIAGPYRAPRPGRNQAP
jgi:multicomponent Na+:H+ antiporter subunit G